MVMLSLFFKLRKTISVFCVARSLFISFARGKLHLVVYFFLLCQLPALLRSLIIFCEIGRLFGALGKHNNNGGSF